MKINFSGINLISTDNAEKTQQTYTKSLLNEKESDSFIKNQSENKPKKISFGGLFGAIFQKLTETPAAPPKQSTAPIEHQPLNEYLATNPKITEQIKIAIENLSGMNCLLNNNLKKGEQPFEKYDNLFIETIPETNAVKVTFQQKEPFGLKDESFNFKVSLRQDVKPIMQSITIEENGAETKETYAYYKTSDKADSENWLHQEMSSFEYKPAKNGLKSKETTKYSQQIGDKIVPLYDEICENYEKGSQIDFKRTVTIHDKESEDNVFKNVIRTDKELFKKDDTVVDKESMICLHEKDTGRCIHKVLDRVNFDY